jgi:hypothetical protein
MTPLRSLTTLHGTSLAVAHALVGAILAAIVFSLANTLGLRLYVGARAIVMLAIFLPISAVYFRWKRALPATAAAGVFVATVIVIDLALGLAAGEWPDSLRLRSGGWLSPVLVFVSTWVMGNVNRRGSARTRRRLGHRPAHGRG